jgi:hypothetical protein
MLLRVMWSLCSFYLDLDYLFLIGGGKESHFRCSAVVAFLSSSCNTFLTWFELSFRTLSGAVVTAKLFIPRFKPSMTPSTHQLFSSKFHSRDSAFSQKKQKYWFVNQVNPEGRFSMPSCTTPPLVPVSPFTLIGQLSLSNPHCVHVSNRVSNSVYLAAQVYSPYSMWPADGEAHDLNNADSTFPWRS